MFQNIKIVKTALSAIKTPKKHAHCKQFFEMTEEIKKTSPNPPESDAPRDDRVNDLITLLNDDESVSMLAEFISESEDRLGQADQILLNIEKEGSAEEHINRLFRVFHSIKGVSGFLQLSDIESISHATETALNRIRKGEIIPTGRHIDMLFDVIEEMRKMFIKVKTSLDEGLTYSPEPNLPSLIKLLDSLFDDHYEKTLVLADIKRGEKIGEILKRQPFQVNERVVEEALERQRLSGRKLGEELLADGSIPPKKIGQALRAQMEAELGHTNLINTIKVNVDRIDHLIELINELVTTETLLANDADFSDAQSPHLLKHMNRLSQISCSLQNIAMSLRMAPIRDIFGKMERLVRDLSRGGNKTITFQTHGEETELDRIMVEHISECLIHMIRNSVDHGIEPEDERIKAGKPAAGSISLSAGYEGDGIVIKLSDDGRGLDREAIMAKAQQQGLIDRADQMSDSEVYQLIFQPGFSTAKEVTRVSGRGVGMDIVMRNLMVFKGRVSIESKPGEGTSFQIILPLTAIQSKDLSTLSEIYQ